MTLVIPVAVLAVLGLPDPQTPRPDAPPRQEGTAPPGRDEKIERFIEHLVQGGGVGAETVRAVLLETEVGRALDELGTAHPQPLASDVFGRTLARMRPEVGEAARALAASDLPAARKAHQALETDGDPWVAAAARLSLAEIALREGRAEESLRRAEAVLARDRPYLLDDHRACEIAAQSYRAQGKPVLESLQLALLLTDFPELPREAADRAGERLRELGDSAGRPLGEVAAWMNEVGKLIHDLQTAEDPTGKRQEEIVTALDKLVELQEARERNACSSCGKSGCNGSCRGGAPKGSTSSSPAKISRAARGEGSLNLHGEPPADPSAVWGLLKDKQGAEALHSFRGKLPERYRRLLEEYYRSLSRGAGDRPPPDGAPAPPVRDGSKPGGR